MTNTTTATETLNIQATRESAGGSSTYSVNIIRASKSGRTVWFQDTGINGKVRSAKLVSRRTDDGRRVYQVGPARHGAFLTEDTAR